MIDVAIIGSGPAGLSAAIYTARAGLSTVVFEELGVGGQLTSISLLENYPGFPEGVNGFDFAFSLKEQAEKFGVSIVYEKVEGLTLTSSDERTEVKQKAYSLKTPTNNYITRSVFIATGAKPTKLPDIDVSSLEGRGVSYCATCDGNFFAGKEVVVVGGGDTAAADALYLSRIASRVHLVHRRDELRANHWYQERVLKDDNIVVHWNCVVTGVEETADSLLGVVLKDVLSSEISLLSCDGLFVAIGTQPTTEWLEGIIERDEQGYLVTDSECETSLPGVYAIGDVRQTPLRQVLTAAADGAIAAEAAVKFLAS